LNPRRYPGRKIRTELVTWTLGPKNTTSLVPKPIRRLVELGLKAKK
jgi:hypothetical protein